MSKRIKTLRKKLGLNQKEFGDRLGVSRDVISNMELGRVEAKEHLLKLICKEFNVNYDWLHAGEGDMFVELDREDELAAWAGKLLHPDNDGSFQQRFVHMLSKLSVEDWKVLEKMAVLMAEENKEDQARGLAD